MKTDFLALYAMPEREGQLAQDDGRSTFAGELIACIAEAREPTVHELFSVAMKVWIEGAAERSAFGWDRLPVEHRDRLRALRAAQAALTGSPEKSS